MTLAEEYVVGLVYISWELLTLGNTNVDLAMYNT
jgi:hypothetical protein